MKIIQVMYHQGSCYLRIDGVESKLFGPVYVRDAARLVSFADHLAKEKGAELVIDDAIVERIATWNY